MEIKVLENSLDYAPIQNKIKQQELKQDFQLCRKMRIKRCFRNEPTPEISTTPAFVETWNLRGNHPTEVRVWSFLSQVEKDLFKISKKVILRRITILLMTATGLEPTTI